MQTLLVVTTILNLVALAASLWLGLYVTTRSRKSVVAWLAACTLWVLAAYFFQGALALNGATTELGWMRSLIIFTAPLWIHVTFLLLPPEARPVWMRWVIIPLSYLTAAILTLLGFYTESLFGDLVDSPAFTSTRTAGAMYVLILPLLIVGFGICFWNLWRARALNQVPAARGQFDALIAATGLVSGAGAYVSIGTLLGLRLPFLVPDLFYFAGVFLFGYTVARYRATMEGRPIDRDFFYTLLVVGSLTLVYCLVVLALYLRGEVSFLSLALTVVGTVLANSMFDRLRLTLDRVFYQRQFQRLRSNLRGLAREAGAGQTLNERLQVILNSTCRFMRIRRGFIATRQGDAFVVSATHDAQPTDTTFASDALESKEIIGLVLPARKQLQDMRLLIPLFAGERQIGAMVLGDRENATAYNEPDLELLEDLGDQIADVIHGVTRQDENAKELNALVEEFRSRERQLQLEVQQMVAERTIQPARRDEWDEDKVLPLVEDGLRHLHDYPYLGEHELAKLRQVDEILAKRGTDAAPTFLDRGKAVSELLTALVDELKPDSPAPRADQVVPREWHLYTILHDSYVEEQPNRETMSKLYISEGTFNRTRRRALRAVAKSLVELEGKAGSAPS